MIPTGGTLRRPPPVTGYVIQLGELETLGNIWLDYAVSWVGFIDIHALPCDAAGCVESSRVLCSSHQDQCLGCGFSMANEH